MHPYQDAARAIREGEEFPHKVARQAGLAAIGGGAATIGSKAVSKILPSIGAFLSPYVPESFAMKGLSKVDPRIGKFIQGAIDEGYTFDDVRAFMGEKLEKSEAPEKTQETAKENRNIIEQYSPELNQFITQQMASGRDPLQAGAIAQNDKRFSSVIKKLSDTHKTPWSSIIEAVYGKEAKALPQQNQQQQAQGSDSYDAFREELKKLLKS